MDAAFIDARTKYGSTPLLFAVKNAHRGATQILLDSGADYAIKDNKVLQLMLLLMLCGHWESVYAIVAWKRWEVCALDLDLSCNPYFIVLIGPDH